MFTFPSARTTNFYDFTLIPNANQRALADQDTRTTEFGTDLQTRALAATRSERIGLASPCSGGFTCWCSPGQEIRPEGEAATRMTLFRYSWAAGENNPPAGGYVFRGLSRVTPELGIFS